MSEDMVERVARALRLGGNYEDMARAAIATMRGPTADMLAAAGSSWDGSKSLSLAAKGIWNSMIDAALTHPVQSSSSPPTPADPQSPAQQKPAE